MAFALLSEKWMIVLLSKDIEKNHDNTSIPNQNLNKDYKR
jgi:hypothetical protein